MAVVRACARTPAVVDSGGLSVFCELLREVDELLDLVALSDGPISQIPLRICGDISRAKHGVTAKQTIDHQGNCSNSRGDPSPFGLRVQVAQRRHQSFQVLYPATCNVEIPRRFSKVRLQLG